MQTNDQCSYYEIFLFSCERCVVNERVLLNISKIIVYNTDNDANLGALCCTLQEKFKKR